MNAYDAHEQELSAGARVQMSGVVTRIEQGAVGWQTIWVRPDLQPKGFEVEVAMHARTLELAK